MRLMPVVMKPMAARCPFAAGRRWRDFVQADLAGDGDRRLVPAGDFQLFPHRARREQDAIQIDRGRVHVELGEGADVGVMIRMHLDGSAAVGERGGDDVTRIQQATAAELEALGHPVFDLLRAAGLDDGHAQVLEQEAAVGRHLRAVAPRVVAADHDRAAVGVRAGEVAEGERVAGDVQADAFHRAGGAQRQHLAAVEGGRAQGFVIRLHGAHAVLFEQRADVAQAIEKGGNRRAGVAGVQVDATGRFEAAFDEEFVTAEDVAAFGGQKAGVDFHFLSVLGETVGLFIGQGVAAWLQETPETVTHTKTVGRDRD